MAKAIEEQFSLVSNEFKEHVMEERKEGKEGNIVIFVYSHVIVVKKLPYIIINITHIYTYIRVCICIYI